MKAEPAKRSRSELRKRHEKFFNELDSLLKNYVATLKPAPVAVKTRQNSKGAGNVSL